MESLIVALKKNQLGLLSHKKVRVKTGLAVSFTEMKHQS